MIHLDFADYPPAYKTAAENLVSNLSKKKEFSEQKQIFEIFCNNYSVTPALWQNWIIREHDATCSGVIGDQIHNSECIKTMTKLFRESSKHFYVETEAFEKHQIILDRPYRKLLTFPDFNRILDFIQIFRLRHVIILEQAMKIPHSKLDQVSRLYERCCDAPLNKKLLKQHENAKSLYAKIMAAKTDIEWLNLLLESKDDEFIVENIEYKLSENPLNKEIWKFYFGYFETECDVRILNLYRRYCRLFIEDSKARKIYANKIEYFQNDGYNVEIWINDLNDFHKYFAITEETYLVPKISDKTPSKFLVEPKQITVQSNDAILFGDEIFYKKCNAFFNPQNSFIQEFSFSKTIMFYITQNYSIVSYRKLIQTCKYFFMKKQVIPIWHFNVMSTVEDHFHKNSIYLGHFYDYDVIPEGWKPSISLNNKIWLEHSVFVFEEFKFMNNIYQSDIKFLYLKVDITFKEYEMLVKSERIKEITFNGMRITMSSTTDDGIGKRDIALEELMKWLPNANKIHFMLNSMLITPLSSQALLQLKRNVKIEYLYILKLTEELKLNEFGKFVQNNIAPNSSFTFHYTRPINENYQNEMKIIVEKIISNYQENKMPKINLYF